MTNESPNNYLSRKERRALKKEELRSNNNLLAKNNKLKKWGIWSVIVIAIAVSIFGISQLGSGNNQNTQLPLDQVAQSDWRKGNFDSKIILIEYSDFECPACAYYSNIVNQIINDYGDKIQLVYRHFPLPGHKNAKEAAYAAEAAGLQGKFWEMHDLIFKNQEIWSKKGNVKDEFINYAQSINLDIDKFKEDMDSKPVKDKVANDYKSGLQAKIYGTPTFYLNGKQITPNSYEEFKSLIEESINKQQQ